MSLESLIRMQSSGVRSIEEPNTPRPGGVPQGAVLVALDVTKEIGTAAVYWALGNVVRRGDNFKLMGIITHVCNPVGFRTRIDKSSWIGNSGIMLQHEFNLKRNALNNIPHVKEWCEKAGVKLEVDVKAGYQVKSIVVDEAKSIGAYHVVLDKTMKSDRKYFVNNLMCFVSRARNSGGVDTVRSFSISKQLPPLLPILPNTVRYGPPRPPSPPPPPPQQQQIHTSASDASVASLGSTHSVSSGSFEMISSDNFLTQDSDLFSLAPTTGESLDRHHESQDAATHRASLPLPRVNGNGDTVNPTGYNTVNRKPALRKWLAEDSSDSLGEAHDSTLSSFIETRPPKILGPAPVIDLREQVRRTPLQKTTFPAPLPPAPVKLHPPPGRTSAGAPVQKTLVKETSPLTTSAPPLSRMPSPPYSTVLRSLSKTVWVWTRSKEVMRCAVEVGWTTFIFTPDTKFMAPQWTSIEWIKPLFLEGGRFLNQEGRQVALLGQVYSGEQLDYLPAMMGGAEIVVINDLDWQIIPPEDVVAAFQGRQTRLFATSNTAADAEVYLEALNVGMDGVVLHTDNVSEIGALRDYLTKKKTEKERAIEFAHAEPPIKEVGEEPEWTEPIPGLTPEPSLARSETTKSDTHGSFNRVAVSPRADANPLNRVGSSPRLVDDGRASPRSAAVPSAASQAPQPGLRLVNATVKSVVAVGQGDRVSVDLCNLLNPGEALLVGSFSKGMFLVHSEILANNTSRKSFRVNAGPVHAYTGMAGGRITYLSELESGGQVLAVDALGNSRTVLVGRVSIESKPLVLVVVEVDGQSFSVMLQESDSVRLVIPAEFQSPGHEARAVTNLQPGDVVVLSMEYDDVHEQ